MEVGGARAAGAEPGSPVGMAGGADGLLQPKPLVDEPGY